MVVYDMEREARRTLHSLSVEYQRGISADDYEVVVVDNGSPRPFNGGTVTEFGANFSYHYMSDASESPAAAINRGAAIARSDFLGVIIDGARILTPGVLKYALLLPAMYGLPYGLTLGWHLGPDFQPRAIERGYKREIEEQLLSDIHWPSDGYRLFEISSFAGSAFDGWFRPVAESNCVFMRRATFETVGGYDERFRSRGGGLVNYDLHARLCELPSVAPVMILGEGTFHQFHNGAATGIPASQHTALWETLRREYQAIRGKEFRPSLRRSDYIGHVPPQAQRWIRESASGLDRFLPPRLAAPP